MQYSAFDKEAQLYIAMAYNYSALNGAGVMCALTE